MQSQMTRRQALSFLGVLALPVDQLFAGAAPVSVVPPAPDPRAGRGPDLANLDPMMNWLAGENAPRLSFLDSRWRSLPAWKRAARPVFNERLCYKPQPVPLMAEVSEREQRDGFTVETVTIRATEAYDIPAKVLVPANRKGRLPGVLALHCHSGQYVWGHEKSVSSPRDSEALLEFRDRVYGRPYAEVLAKRGFVVIVIDAFYFGARRLRPEEIDPADAPGDARDGLRALSSLEKGSREWLSAVNRLCGQYEHLTAKTVFAAGSTWPGILAWDEMRTVDYLCSRPEVDPRRIGCVGLSLGGIRTAHLIAADPRIKVACVTGWMPEFSRLLRNYIRSHTWMVYVPGLYQSLDLPDAAGLIAPGALLVQQCRRDNLYPTSAMQGGVEKLQKIFAKAGIPERFRGSFHDEPHSFRPEMQDEAFEWIERFI